MLSLVSPYRSEIAPRAAWTEIDRRSRAVATYETGNRRRYASRLYSHDAPTTWTRSCRVRCLREEGGQVRASLLQAFDAEGKRAPPCRHSGSGGGGGPHAATRRKSSRRWPRQGARPAPPLSPSRSDTSTLACRLRPADPPTHAARWDAQDESHGPSQTGYTDWCTRVARV